MLDQTTPAVSAIAQIRAIPLDEAEKIWASGNTIRDYPEPAAPVAPWLDPDLEKHHPKYCPDKALCYAHLQERKHLLATSEPVPTLTEYHGSGETARTHDVPLELELRQNGFRSATLDGGDSDDDNHLANRVSEYYHATQYEHIDPITVKRIEWERRTRLSSEVYRFRIRPDGVVQVLGTGLTFEKRLELAKRYIARLQRELGSVPTREQITRWLEATQGRSLGDLFPGAGYDFEYSTYTEGDEDPTRESLHTQDTPGREDATPPVDTALGLDWQPEPEELEPQINPRTGDIIMPKILTPNSEWDIELVWG